MYVQYELIRNAGASYSVLTYNPTWLPRTAPEKVLGNISPRTSPCIVVGPKKFSRDITQQMIGSPQSRSRKNITLGMNPTTFVENLDTPI